MHLHGFNTSSAPFRLSRMSVGLLAVLTHFGAFAVQGIAVTSGGQETHNDAEVSEKFALAGTNKYYAIFLSNGSSLTLGADPVTINAPTSYAVLMQGGSSLIFSKKGIINTAKTGIDLENGGRVKASDLTINTGSSGITLQKGGTVEADNLTINLQDSASAIASESGARSTVTVKTLTSRADSKGEA